MFDKIYIFGSCFFEDFATKIIIHISLYFSNFGAGHFGEHFSGFFCIPEITLAYIS